MKEQGFYHMLAKLGIDDLNVMQQEAMEHILRGRNDVVVLSPTGTGKTLAYLLPLVQMLDAAQESVQALVVVPGRELALQSDQVQKSMGSGLRSQACYGGRTAMDEHRVLKQNRPQLVFGTPGRLNDHKLPCLERRFLLSATDTDLIPRFVEMGRTDRLEFLDEEEPVNDRVEVYRVDSPEKDKLQTLAQLLMSLGSGQSIVFLNYRDAVERTDEFLRKRGFVTSAFHGGLDQRQREDALYKFSNGSATVLVSTDLASRGLDIPNIDNIIHYHMPMNEEALVHRVGRTARWDASGKTFFLVGPEEHMPEYVAASDVVDYLLDGVHVIPQPQMATIYIGKGKKDKISKGDIMGFLCKKGGLERTEIGRIDVNDRYAYAAVKRERLQQVIKLTKGEKIKGVRTVIEPVR